MKKLITQINKENPNDYDLGKKLRKLVKNFNEDLDTLDKMSGYIIELASSRDFKGVASWKNKKEEKIKEIIKKLDK